MNGRVSLCVFILIAFFSFLAFNHCPVTTAIIITTMILLLFYVFFVCVWFHVSHSPPPSHYLTSPLLSLFRDVYRLQGTILSFTLLLFFLRISLSLCVPAALHFLFYSLFVCRFVFFYLVLIASRLCIHGCFSFLGPLSCFLRLSSPPLLCCFMCACA